MITVFFSDREKSGGFKKKKKESSSKLWGHVLPLIAKVKWECDNDSADTEQLWEASWHRRFLDADTFLIQRSPSGSRVTIPLSENTFCPPWRPLVVTQNLHTWPYGPSQSLYVQHTTRLALVCLHVGQQQNGTKWELLFNSSDGDV